MKAERNPGRGRDEEAYDDDAPRTRRQSGKSGFGLWMQRCKAWCVNAARTLWAVLSNRLGLKLLSLALAILLWNYVINANSTITRAKTLTGLSGYVTGQDELNNKHLALTSDPSEALTGVTVQLDVPQSQYGQALASNVQVTLNLSSVRTAGTQQVPLRATSSYGRVTGILPESITLTFEALDSRSIPVNVEISGEQQSSMWYSVTRTNPTYITVSGAASLVRSINQARVSTDVSGQNSTYWRAEPFALLDEAGNELPQSTLTTSVSSVTAIVDIYPTKEIPIAHEIESVVTGRVADGYTISDVSIQPESITVAANQDFLDSLSELQIEPVNVQGQSRSMVARANIVKLTDFRNLSAEQVYVNITISEESASEWVVDNVFTFVGKAADLELSSAQSEGIKVHVSGPRSQVQQLRESGVPIVIDLTGLGPGEHSVPLKLPTENYPDISFEPEVAEITVTLTQTGGH